MQFNATERKTQGTGASRRLRNAGRVPGIVYGGEGQPQMIDMDHNEMWQAVHKPAFHTSVLDMNLDGKSSQVLLRDVQMHPYRQQILHLDFLRVTAGQKITVRVPSAQVTLIVHCMSSVSTVFFLTLTLTMATFPVTAPLSVVML